MKHILSFVMLFFILGVNVFAQVGINIDNSQPDPAAMLDVKSTSKGILPPRMTTAQMNSVVTPPEGLLVYNTSMNSLYWYNGTIWKRFNDVSFTETDPIFTAHPAYGITAASITYWNAAFSWGPHAGLYPPLGRTLTINGSTQDLNANRTWSVGTVTSIAAAAPLTGGTITGSGTIGIPPATSIASGYLSSADWNTFNSKVSSQWTTTGSDIYYITGNVGIGITNPSFPLHTQSGQSASASAVAYVNNTYTGTTPYIYGIYAKVNSSSTAVSGSGIGIYGLSNNTVGGGVGVYGYSNGSTGFGVKAIGGSSTGINYGLYASTNSTTGYAGYFLANSATGVNYGLYAATSSTDGYAGYFNGGKNYFSGNVGIGEPSPISPLHIVSDQSGTASSVALVHSTYSGTNPWIYAIKGQVNSSSTSASGPGIGVLGISNNTVGGGAGVFGQSNGSTGYGVKALGNSSTGVNYGLYASTSSSSGYAGYFLASSSTGVNYGLYASTSSVDGYAGYFSGGKNYFSGDVGIGTITPLAKLHVHDPSSSNTTILITPKAISSNDSSTLFFAEDNDGTYGMYWMYEGVGNLMELWGKSGATKYGPHLAVNRDNGNMAIGSTFATGYKLSVSGKIICTELRVNLVADWPDYVFKKDYKLLPVEKLGAYIQENGHLPNIPPAEEINKSGLDVGEMQKRMMEKIEELSLYIVEQQKQIQALKEQLNHSR